MKGRKCLAQPIIAASKSKAQKQREYRQRIAASRTPAEAAAARKLKHERQRKNRLRQAANLAIVSDPLEATRSRSGEESNYVPTRSQHTQQSTTTNQPDKPVHLNEPLFPAIVPMEVQEAPASATPFAKITGARKTRAQIQREYRQRFAASKTPEQAAAARAARNARDRKYRLRQANLVNASGLEATTTSSSRSRLNIVHIETQRLTNQCQTLATKPTETTVQPSTSDRIEVQAQSTWKQELKPASEDYSTHIKHETEDIDTDNPFANLQIEIKQEIQVEKEPEQSNANPQSDNSDNTNIEIHIKTEVINPIGNEISIINVKNEAAESILPNDDEVDLRQSDSKVKEEIKTENDDIVKDFPIKEETHPVSNEQGYKISNPEEILPTSDNNYKMDFGDSFLRNSITGNVLSLEQEAYGLLKSKKKVPFEGYTQKCPKCAKWFRTKYDVKKHLRVHDGIEKRAMGLIKGLKTKRENYMKRKEKLHEENEP